MVTIVICVMCFCVVPSLNKVVLRTSFTHVLVLRDMSAFILLHESLIES